MVEKSELEEVVASVNTRKGKTTENRLHGLKCYLAGPIDYAEDDGKGWRKKMTKWLTKYGVMVFDPCDKKVAHAKYKEVDEEKKKMMTLKASGRFFELTQRMKEIVHYDLRMTDISDFLIVYINPEIPMFGTIHELLNSLHQRKPTLVVIEGGKKNVSNWLFGIMDFNFMFDDFDDLKDYLGHVDDGTIQADLSRWVFFD